MLILGPLHFHISLRQLVDSCKRAVGVPQEWCRVCRGCGEAVLSAVTVCDGHTGHTGTLGAQILKPCLSGVGPNLELIFLLKKKTRYLSSGYKNYTKSS